MAFSDKALKLIIAFEGLNQPGKWPGAQSGVTLGYGYDLGYVTVDQFESDWEDCFTDQQSARLQAAVGKHGAAAQALAPSLADIKCSAADSLRVFLQRTIPAYTARARLALPGFDQLPLDAQGALVSLAYNRGTSMKDSPGQDNRREMRAIRDLVPRMDLGGIAAQLRSMKRLWQGKGLDGLIRRREAEAVLVDSCIAAPGTRGLRRTITGTRAIAPSRRAPKKLPDRTRRKSPPRSPKKPPVRTSKKSPPPPMVTPFRSERSLRTRLGAAPGASGFQRHTLPVAVTIVTSPVSTWNAEHTALSATGCAPGQVASGASAPGWSACATALVSHMVTLPSSLAVTIRLPSAAKSMHRTVLECCPTAVEALGTWVSPPPLPEWPARVGPPLWDPVTEPVPRWEDAPVPVPEYVFDQRLSW